MSDDVVIVAAIGAAQPVRVLGLEIDDEEVAEMVKRILYLAIATCCYLFVLETVRLVSAIQNSQNLGRSLSILAITGLISCSIPACGWYGARDRHRGLMFCFFAWSCCCVVLLLVSMTISLVWLADPPAEQEGRRRGPPEGYLGNAILSFFGMLLNGMAVYWGFQLWRNPFFAGEASPNDVEDSVVVHQPNAQGVETRQERLPSMGNSHDAKDIDKEEVRMVQI